MNESMDDMTVDVAAAIAAYPRAKARTLRFSAGAPRMARAIGDGTRALFLRSRDADDLAACLWVSEFLPSGPDAASSKDVHRERLLADPRALLASADDEDVSPEERARRERSREGGHGIVGYSVDAAGRRVAFALGSRLWVADVDAGVGNAGLEDAGLEDAGTVREVTVATGPVIAPRISPDGTMVAYSTAHEVRVVALGEGSESDSAGAQDRMIGAVTAASVDAADVEPDALSIGLADFIAGEEMDRYDGLWWSPDSRTLLVQTTDESAEPLWHITDPADPAAPAVARHYPQALTVNARVRLFAVPVDDSGDAASGDAASESAASGAAVLGHAHLGVPAEIVWDAASYEYLAVVRWTRGDGPLLLVQNRRQNADQVLAAHPPVAADGNASDGNASDGNAAKTGAPAPAWTTETLATHTNDRWLDLFPGAPALTPDGRLICVANDMAADANRLTVDGVPFTTEGVQVRAVLDVTDDDVLAVVSTDPRSFDVVSIGYDGRMVALNQEPGVWTASRSGVGTVVWGRTMADAHTHMMHIAVGHGAVMIDNRAARPGFVPNVRFVELGEHALLAAVTMPSPGSAADARLKRGERLPVLLKPYGGPGHQEVVYDQSRYWDAQWWADQGFIVLTADGRGTPGRGPAWDREIFEDFKGVTLADQVEAVGSFAQVEPAADAGRVAMIGWSYGGFLSAAAVLDAPDAIHAACAGAPPTDWALYDTHYTERYLGLDPEVYRRNSLIDDAANLTRPLLLIHGFADDNVTVANTLRLSQALLAAGRAHEVLPLNGITHMTNDETVAENLLLLQLDFLRRALG